jgi:hypothetical protein
MEAVVGRGRKGDGKREKGGKEGWRKGGGDGGEGRKEWGKRGKLSCNISSYRCIKCKELVWGHETSCREGGGELTKSSRGNLYTTDSGGGGFRSDEI